MDTYGIFMKDGINYSHDTAKSISYDNSTSNLNASDVQDAIDEITSTGVFGVKGNSETTYRTGNVNITKANIGLSNVGNFKAVSTVANQGLTDTEKTNARTNIGAGTVNTVSTGAGLTGGDITTTGTIKVDIKSETVSTLTAANKGTTSNREYAVGLDANSDLSVNIPWTDTKVTSVGNHYAPAEDTSATLSADASGGDAATWGTTSMVTGVDLKRDAKGHVVGITVDSIKMPANPDTDTKVTQTATTTNSAYEVLFSGTADNTSRAEVSRKNSNLTFNPSTGRLQSSILKLYREGTTDQNYPASIEFAVKDTTTGQTYSSAYINAYNDHGATTYGANLVINPGGNLFIGSGEAPGNHYALYKSSTTENTFVTADGTIYIQANGNTIANRVGAAIDTSGNIVPSKADTATNNIGGIGTSAYKWANGYFTNINGVAVGDSPKFTDTTYDVVSKTADGLVPKLPNETATTKFLRQDGTWVAPSGTVYSAGTNINIDTNNKISTTAEVNQNAFSNIKVGSTTVAADTKTDTVEYTASGILTITPDATNDKITFGVATGTTSATAAAGNHTHSAATTAAAGLMSAADKTKLNGIATGAEVNQNAFSNIVVGTTTVAADGKQDSVTFVGDNITITPDATNDKITFTGLALGAASNQAAAGNHTHTLNIAADSGTSSLTLAASTKYKLTAGGGTYIFTTPPNTTYSAATTAAAGLMSAADKTKLNGIATNAEVNQYAFSNIKVGSTTVAADTKTDTVEYAASGILSITGDATNDKVTFGVSTGTTSATAAAGNHTHGLNIATDSGASSLSMSANTKYKITAGGSSYIFTTPAAPSDFVSKANGGTFDKKITIASGGLDVTGPFTLAGNAAFDAANGSASAVGYTSLTLGNATSTGTAKNSKGRLRLYSNNDKYINVMAPDDITASGDGYNVLLPNTSGTLALSSHTHTLNIAADSGTSSLTLAASTKYKLSAGGSSYVFTTPPNTTYTFATGDNNGQIKVTPSGGGSAQNVSVKGLGTAAYTASSAYATSSHTHTASEVGALALSMSPEISTVEELSQLATLSAADRGFCGPVKVTGALATGLGIDEDWTRMIAIAQNTPSSTQYSQHLNTIMFTSSTTQPPKFFTVQGTKDNHSLSDVRDFVVDWMNTYIRMKYGAEIGNISNQSFLIRPGRYELNNGIQIGTDTGAGWNLRPLTTNSHDLGLPSFRWRTIYLNNNPDVSSDRNLKKDIIYLNNNSKDFILNLKPVSYKLKNDTSSNPNKIHYGLIAQDVSETMDKFDMNESDYGFISKNQKYEDKKVIETRIDDNGKEIECERIDRIPVEGEYEYSLKYDEFIAPLIKTVQIQQQEIDMLKEEIRLLKEKL